MDSLMRMTLSLVVLLAAVVPTFAQLPPDKALATMQPGPGLQVELFAAEPMVINPTAIDVDHKGRVWVCEGVNYRCKLRNRPLYRKEGDRIEILIDEKGEGKATKTVTFYQGTDLMAPLGVCVIPQADGKALRVLVAQSPDILEFWDKDGDLKADGPPTKFLTGFGGIDHDHGVHGLSTGPDGKLYFTVGDQGVKGLQSKDGKGKSWTTNRTDCQAATVWRCDLDGNNLELIAHNFRNNYECCVDSFGEIWLSDNDDDGNQQTRICHVLPGGNYGYWPRGPGQSHWHEEQPGIVHKTLRTGFGSPTGITFYEGSLLPKQYQGDLIHCDAGPREVRYFKRTPKGAGYELEKTVMLTSTDNWFRPSAVRVAPDGSVFIADWYDPGVGGHGMGDWKQGRIYRLTPRGHKGYKNEEINLNADDTLRRLFNSPNISARAQAVSRLAITDVNQKMDVIHNNFRLAKCFEERGHIIQAVPGLMAWKDAAELVEKIIELDMEHRMAPAAVRIMVEYKKQDELRALLGGERNGVKWKDLNKRTAEFKREYLIAIKDVVAVEVKASIIEFAKLYDGSDRFYLSALNIACGTDPVRRDAILADFEKHFPEWNDKVADLVWELRPKSMLSKMNKLLDDPKLTAKQKARIVDILAVNDSAEAGKSLIGLLNSDRPRDVKLKVVENLKLFLPTKWAELKKSEELKSALTALLANPADRVVGLQLAAVAPDSCDVELLLKYAADQGEPKEVRAEAVKAASVIKTVNVVRALEALSADAVVSKEAVAGIARHVTGGKGDDHVGAAALETLEKMLTASGSSAELKSATLSALAGTRQGTLWLLKQKQDGKMPAELIAEAGKLLRNSPFQGERNRAYLLFPVTTKLDVAKLPPIGDLSRLIGDAGKGKALFTASVKTDMQCMKCHKVNGQGGEIGPDLSAIGTKGSRQNLFESILYPSRAIADQHVSWVVGTADGQTITGLLVKETDTALTIRDANGKDTVIDVKNVESRKKSAVSLMSEDLVKTMTETELVDLVAYLETLKAVEKK